MDTAKMFWDSDRTIPIDPSDPEIARLQKELYRVQQEKMTAVALAIKTVQAAAAAVQRALDCSKLFDIEDMRDPRTIGLHAELEAARLQSQAACAIASEKMQAFVDVLKAIEATARKRNLRFN
jgi:hypothetical protein